MKVYTSLAPWWSVLTPPGTYDVEAEFFLSLLGADIQSILELGAGIGAIASSFPAHLERILVDRSAEMLNESKKRNPTAEHICSCAFDLYLSHRVDAVLIHDSIMYMTNIGQLEEMFACGYRHLNPEGRILVVPDVVREYFHEHALSGGAEEDNKSIQMMEWHWDPNPHDQTYQMELSLLMREDGTVHAHHESHTLGLFTIKEYCDALEKVGFSAIDVGTEGRYFLAKK